MHSLIIDVTFDKEDAVWVATNDEISLVAEGATRLELAAKIEAMIPDLAELNGYQGKRPLAFQMREMPRQ